MNFETKLRELEEEFRNLLAVKETLERRLTFHRGWAQKVSRRLEDFGGVKGATSRPTPGAPRNLWDEFEMANRMVAGLEKEHSEILDQVKAVGDQFKKERSRRFEFGWIKTDIGELVGRGKKLRGWQAGCSLLKAR